jgi:hypothetical protein
MIAIPALKSVSKPFTRRTTWIGVLAGASIAAGLAGPAWSDEKVPDLGMSSSSFAWTPLTINGTIARYGTGWFDPPGGLRGPIHQHPDYPLRGNDTGRPTPALGNWKDPILKPWAAEKMRVSNEELLTGKTGIPFLPQSRCWPGGTPGQLLWTTEPIYFIQTPKEVVMHWQRDQWVRHIYLTDKHSPNAKKSRYGDSIGHYENGEFVIDTTNIASMENSVLDMFRTPFTDKIHVTERYKITPDNKFLEALIRVEDPDTFNEPMYMAKRWRRDTNNWVESICAENNGDFYEANLVPVPQAKRPDF